jgi:hypothetical protein
MNKTLAFSLFALAVATLALAANVATSRADTVYDAKSSPAAIAVDKQVKAEIATQVYPVDPTPAYMLTNSVCTGVNAFGCTSGGGAAGAAAGSGE